MLEGLLVDLVPVWDDFPQRETVWRNSDASFWSSGGERYIMSRAAVERQFAQWAQHDAQARVHRLSFGIQTKDGQRIGWIGINWMVPHNRLAMLGAKIGEPDYWGGGYGTDALLLLIDHAFDWLDMRKIWLYTTSMNARVKRQMEKVGFTLEAQIREGTYADGAWYDWLAYSLFDTEWPGREALVASLGLRERAAALEAAGSS